MLLQEKHKVWRFSTKFAFVKKTSPFSFCGHLYYNFNRESPAQCENRIKPRVYVRRIRRSTMYENAQFC